MRPCAGWGTGSTNLPSDREKGVVILSLIIIVLLILCVWQAYRLRTTNNLLGAVIDAAAKGTPVLMERAGGLIRARRLDEMVAAYNRLIKEKAVITDSGKDYFDQIRTTLENLREAVVMVDRVNTIWLANPAFSELVPFAAAPKGKRLDLFIQGEKFHEFLREVRQGQIGRRKEFEVQIGTATRWLEVSAAPLQEKARSDGHFTLFVFHDITRQKGLEKMRTEFVANVSHELRTPVTVIKGFAETLLEDDLVLKPEEKVRFLKKILSNTKRLHHLLQDLLLLSRLESTEMVLQQEELSLSAVLGELAETWGSILEEGGQRLILQFTPGNDRILADPLRLSQVITNLLENVVRHARGFTQVHLTTRLEEKGVRVIVEDDGAGIPEKDLPHIFQRFYRVEKGRSRELGGTGLGLSIVKHIVVQHRGEITARSTKGKGTAIEIFLPYAPSKAVKGDFQYASSGT